MIVSGENYVILCEPLLDLLIVLRLAANKHQGGGKYLIF